MAPRKEFEHESLEAPDTLVGYLRALADGFEKGEILLGTDGKDVSFKPRGLLRLRLQARRGKSRARLDLHVSWREDRDAPEEQAPPLRISAGDA